MSYDFAIWKRSSSTKTAMLSAAYEAICDGRAHDAVDTFDTSDLVHSIEAAFPYSEANPEARPFTLWAESVDGSSWVVVSCTFPAASAVSNTLVGLALARGLMLWDPQRQVVWGNRRPSTN